jgi:putative transcriptional regulator
VSHAGRLLVATPLIADPNFERTVVLLLAHGPQGAFGVVLNRPSDTRADAVAPEWADDAASPAVVFVGGPVGPESILALGRSIRLVESGGDVIVGDCGPVDLRHPPATGGFAWDRIRLFAGSAGWAPGQLEDELAEGAWWGVDADPGDITCADPDGMWSRVLRRHGGDVAWFANYPGDPSAN